MATLLYQKYRPNTFKEVVGNFKAVKELSFRAKEKSLPQTILLSGSSGTGKTTLQRILSKALTCNNLSSEGEPCNECNYCKDINTESFTLACYEYNGAEIGKQQVLEIQDKAEAMSLSSSVKIFFIDEFQGLFVNTDKALDTLLKIIEKPYKDVYFILGTMDFGAIQSHSKGKAVLNRCAVYKMQDLSLKEIGGQLNHICKQEGIKVDSDKASILLDIAEYSSGSLRTAISLLERCIFSNIWTKEELQSELGVVSSDSVAKIVDKILSGDITVLETSNFNKELIPFVRSYLLTLYKTKLSISLPFGAVNIKPSSMGFDINIVYKGLTLFNDMKAIPYMDYITFESILINFIKEILPPDNSKNIVTTTRRKLVEQN